MMKNITTFLMLTIGVLLVLVSAHSLCGCGRKFNMIKEIIGTWTTEGGIEKLLISRGSLNYTCESYDIEGTCKYVIKHLNFKEKKTVCTQQGAIK